MSSDLGRTVAHHQDGAHGVGHDYASGSPHLRHESVRRMVTAACRGVVDEVRHPRCRVLEIGAGHGLFTDYLVGLGAEVWVTEMSKASADLLRSRFAGHDDVHVIYDQDGSGAARGPEVDVVICLSVLHHIPDYLGAVSAWLDRLAPGGAFVSFQDPLWYSRRSRGSLLAERGAYLMWRVTRGDLRRALATGLRRVRGRYDPQNPSDMVEYHVVRDGVDEEGLIRLLGARFDSVRVHRYWSTQAAWLQWLGDRVGPVCSFGITATGHHSSGLGMG
jgi:SAM-dependent methyltransferase